MAAYRDCEWFFAGAAKDRFPPSVQKLEVEYKTGSVACPLPRSLYTTSIQTLVSVIRALAGIPETQNFYLGGHYTIDQREWGSRH
ncbi:hypothetical protein RUM8411_01761 [Ruegeria meonggei]|uniref:Uncharacterized protein n=1 Tax=Ruegeria meonggei TaxID=1446476 RepID=A0A1X6Z333_9RHOB|nr:hypothetical protein RUM8411_01761 [Ruegeria meonggei]